MRGLTLSTSVVYAAFVVAWLLLPRAAGQRVVTSVPGGPAGLPKDVVIGLSFVVHHGGVRRAPDRAVAARLEREVAERTAELDAALGT